MKSFDATTKPSDEDIQLDKENYATNVLGMFKTVAAVPTEPPKNWFDQIVYYKSGATIRIYIYDTANSTWSYAALT